MNYTVERFIHKQGKTQQLFSKNNYAVLIVLHGKCDVIIDENSFECSVENMIILKPNETIKVKYSGKKSELDILWFQFSQEILAKMSTQDSDLVKAYNDTFDRYCFTTSESDTYLLVKNSARKLLLIPSEADHIANSVIEEGFLKIIFALILRTIFYPHENQLIYNKKILLVNEICLYISKHLTEDMTLEHLEKTFFVSRYHIAREFKKQTGETVHTYIIKRKLSLCCSYIEKGMPIKEVYKISGIGGYNNFFKVFKKFYGMTPKEYYNLKTQ